MPGNSRTARLIIEVREGRAVRGLNRVNRSMGRVRRTMRGLTRGIRRVVGSGFAIMIKALISMVAVLVVFNLVLTAPQTAFRALISLISITIRALSEFEQRILSLQAILTSTVRFLADPVENFRNAGLVAAGIVETLALRANEMVTSLSEATIVFQTLLATGAQNSVRDVDKLVDLTILLSNSIAGITTGQDRQRQLAEETRSLFTGQLRATSLLGRLLFRNRREMRLFFREAEASDMVVERLSERLRGFSLIARDLARTVEGLQTTFVTFLQVIARRAFSGILEGLENRIGDLFDEIQKDTAGLNLLAANLASSVEIIINTLVGIVRRVFGVELADTENLLNRITNILPTITEHFLRILFVIEDSGKLLNALVLTLRAIGIILAIAYRGWRLILEAIVAIVGAIPGLNTLFEAGTQLIANMDDGFARASEHIAEAGRLTNEVFDGTSQSARVAAALSSLYVRIARNLKLITEAEREREEASRGILRVRRADLTVQIEITNELLKQGRALRSQVSSIIQVIQLSARGGGLAGIRIAGNISEIEESIREQIRVLGQARVTAGFNLTRAELPGVLADPDQIIKLKANIAAIEGEMASLSSQLIALNALFAEFGRVTADALTRAFGDQISGTVFKNLFEFLKTEEFRASRLFLTGLPNPLLTLLPQPLGSCRLLQPLEMLSHLLSHKQFKAQSLLVKLSKGFSGTF